jgi:hypothetical protein
MLRAGQLLLWALVGVAKLMALSTVITDAAAWQAALAWLALAWGLAAAAVWLRGWARS